MTSCLLPFGLHHGQLISVAAVASGLACDCVCPACYQPLIARKGQRNAHHFSHYRSKDCPHALETALHLKAKAILEQAKRIVVPPVYLHRQPQPLYPAQLVRFRRVYLENYLEELLPDIVMQAGNRTLLVEIKVTHGLARHKIKRLRRLGLATIEIDLSAMLKELTAKGKGLDEAAFRNHLINHIDHKKWLYQPKQAAAEHALRQQADRKTIQHRKFGKYHQQLVQNCPRHLHYWRRGPLEGKTYANVQQDCQHCRYCLEVAYAKAWVGYREVSTRPTHVYCWAKAPTPKVPDYRCSI